MRLNEALYEPVLEWREFDQGLTSSGSRIAPSWTRTRFKLRNSLTRLIRKDGSMPVRALQGPTEIVNLYPVFRASLPP